MKVPLNNISEEYYFPAHYDFEDILDTQHGLHILQTYRHVCLLIVVIYFTTIIALKRVMKDRPPYNLKLSLSGWNFMLALFSILATLRLGQNHLYVTLNYGYTTSVCNNSLFLKSQVTTFWGGLYIFSKVVELGDTAFLLLRKKRLIFLHWYHHAVTMTMVFYLADRATAIAHWFTVLNLFVHSFMYTYYFLMSIDIKLPRWTAICLTSCQVMQMVIGMFVSLSSFTIYMSGVKCDFPVSIANVCLGCYAVYFYLFCRFFYLSYLAPKSKKVQ